MPGINNIVGEYTYLSIKKGLTRIISHNVYTEEHISLVIHVDGMQIYYNSPKQVWPIAVKVYIQIISKLYCQIFCSNNLLWRF